MRYVILIILALCIVFAALNLIEASNKPKEIKEIVKQTEEIVPNALNEKELLEKGFEPVIKNLDIHFDVLNWSLKGTQKNILVIDVFANNPRDISIKNLTKNIVCNFYQDEKLLGNVSKVQEFNIVANGNLELEVNMGFIDIDTNKISCTFNEYEIKKPINPIKIETVSPSNSNDDLPLPKLF